MKFFSAICFLLFNISIYAQQKDSIKSFAVKINPLQLCVGELRLLGEKKIKRQQSAELIVSYFYPCLLNDRNPIFSSIPWGGIDPPEKNAFKIGLGYRYYFDYSSKENLYINPLLFYSQASYTDVSSIFSNYYFPFEPETLYTVSRKMYSLQINIGKLFVKNSFLYEFYFGLGIRYKESLITNEEYDDHFHPTLVSSNKDNGYYYKTFPTIQFGLNIGFTK